MWGLSWRPLGTEYRDNQKSNSCENLSPFLQCACPKIRHQCAILTPSWQVPPALLTFKRHLPVTKADVLPTFCTYIRYTYIVLLVNFQQEISNFSRVCSFVNCSRKSSNELVEMRTFIAENRLLVKTDQLFLEINLQNLELSEPISSFLEMALSANNKYLALFADTGLVWIGSSNLIVS